MRAEDFNRLNLPTTVPIKMDISIGEPVGGVDKRSQGGITLKADELSKGDYVKTNGYGEGYIITSTPTGYRIAVNKKTPWDKATKVNFYDVISVQKKGKGPFIPVEKPDEAVGVAAGGYGVPIHALRELPPHPKHYEQKDLHTVWDKFKKHANKLGFTKKVVGDFAFQKGNNPQNVIKLVSAKKGKVLVSHPQKGRYYLEENMKEQKKGKFQKIADEVVSILQRDRIARSLGFDRIYSSHSNGIHFDFFGGGFTFTLDPAEDWELEPEDKGDMVLDLAISGESPKEVDGIMDLLTGTVYNSTAPNIAKLIVNDILQSATDAEDAYKMTHSDEYEPEESLSKAMRIFNNLCEMKVGQKFTMDKTYEIITPKSAEQGDAEERGFEYKDQEFDTLWDMAKEIRDAGATEPSEYGHGTPHTWYSTVDPDRDYKTGEETYYSFHPRNLTYEQARELKNLVLMNDKQFNSYWDKYYPNESELKPKLKK